MRHYSTCAACINVRLKTSFSQLIESHVWINDIYYTRLFFQIHAYRYRWLSRNNETSKSHLHLRMLTSSKIRPSLQNTSCTPRSSCRLPVEIALMRIIKGSDLISSDQLRSTAWYYTTRNALNSLIVIIVCSHNNVYHARINVYNIYVIDTASPVLAQSHIFMYLVCRSCFDVNITVTGTQQFWHDS